VYHHEISEISEKALLPGRHADVLSLASTPNGGEQIPNKYVYGTPVHIQVLTGFVTVSFETLHHSLL
jgi:hypothetical protein